MTEKVHVCGIHRFEERDICLLLAEELRVNADFGRWVLAHFGSTDHILFPAIKTDLSVQEDGSEADVIAEFETTSGDTHKLYIEDKINATMQPNQLQRYIRRAEGDVRKGLISSFSILFFTPSKYFIDSIPTGVFQLSFESAAKYFRQNGNDLRSEYRASLLENAAPKKGSKAREKKIEQVPQYRKDWWHKVYMMLDRDFPGFFDSRPGYPKDVYTNPKIRNQAGYIRLDLKGDKGEVALSFPNVTLESLSGILATLESYPGQLVKFEKSSALEITGLEPFVISDGLGIIDTKVRAAYQAAHDLLSYWSANRAAFDTLKKVQ